MAHPRKIVRPDRLLDPVDAAFVVDHAPAADRLGDGEPLVEVHHERDLRPDLLLHRLERFQIFFAPKAFPAAA